MNSSLGTDTGQKLNRMQTMAVALYRAGDHDAALKIWRRIQETNPDYPDIGNWIERCSQLIKAQSPGKPRPDPSIFRAQRDIMAQQGQGPRRRVFHPKTSHVRLKAGIRHRHVVYIFLVFILGIILLSIRNNRSYMIVLNPVTNKLDCYQGNFFPLGWQKTLEMEVGIESDWSRYVDNQNIIRTLNKGVVVHNVSRFDEQIIDIFMTLGDESLLQMTERGQQSAIYYYKRISSARFADRVSGKIVKAFVNLARIKLIEKDYENAWKYFHSASEYGINDGDLMKLQKELESVQKSGYRHF